MIAIDSGSDATNGLRVIFISGSDLKHAGTGIELHSIL